MRRNPPGVHNATLNPRESKLIFRAAADLYPDTHLGAELVPITGIGKFLQTRRTRRGMTQEELAAAAEVPSSNIKAIETETSQPHFRRAAHLYSCLGGQALFLAFSWEALLPMGDRNLDLTLVESSAYPSAVKQWFTTQRRSRELTLEQIGSRVGATGASVRDFEGLSAVPMPATTAKYFSALGMHVVYCGVRDAAAALPSDDINQ